MRESIAIKSMAQSWPAETSDVAKAREALNGPEIRSAVQEAGVVGPPKIHVMA